MLYQDFETYNAWIGNRVAELLVEFGYKKRLPFANKIGISKNTFHRIIDEERGVDKEELKLIADGFGISVERLKQDDVKRDYKELTGLLESGNLPQRAVSIAASLLSMAIGDSEKSEFNRSMGVAFGWMKRYEEAEKHLEKSLNLAVRTGNEKLICRVIISCIIFKYERGEFEEVCRLVTEYKDWFIENKENVGYLYHFKGLCSFNKGDIMEAKKDYEKACSAYLSVGDEKRFAVIQVNIADIEYSEKNYEKAKELLLSAKSKVSENKDVVATLNKDLVRVYIALNEISKADSLLDYQLEEFDKKSIDKPEIYAKLLLMKAGISGESDYAEKAYGLQCVSKEVKKTICDFLVTHFMSVGDMEKATKYYSALKNNFTEKILKLNNI